MGAILLVGATTGIGRALAENYARQGYLVGATGRRSELLHALQSEFPDRVKTLTCDVTDSRYIELLEAFARDLGGVDLVIYNAGIGLYNKKMNWQPEADTIAVNVRGFTETATWAYRYFRERGAGHFVGISSVAALFGNATAPAYSASKAFETNYMEAMRMRAKQDKLPVFITDIRPGFVDTPMTKGQKGMFWVASAEKAAPQILSAIRRRKKVAYITRRWALIARLLLFWRFLRNH